MAASKMLICFAAGLELRYAAFDAGDHQILDADIGKGAAGHDAVVAAARSVAVEIDEIDAVLDEILSGGRRLLDAARRGDMVGGHAVAKNAERARALDFGDVTGLEAEVLEERRLLDVGAFFVPLINLAGLAGISFHLGFWAAKSR